jgi:hypothetical protein
VHHGAVVRLAGREREVATLEQALQRARSGEGGVVAVSGDPGIGKTTLARALGRVSAQLGVPVLGARGVESGAPAYWPWLHVLRARAEQVGDAALRVDAGWGAAELVRLAPDLGPRRISRPATCWCSSPTGRRNGMRMMSCQTLTRFTPSPASACGDRRNHVQHILTKLGLANRTQIGAWVATRPTSQDE